MTHALERLEREGKFEYDSNDEQGMILEPEEPQSDPTNSTQFNPRCGLHITHRPEVGVGRYRTEEEWLLLPQNTV